MLSLVSLLLVLFFLVPLSAQTIAVQVWSNREPTTGQSDPLPNRGQSQHTLRIQFANAGGACNAGSQVYIYLEASTDSGANWFPITPRSVLIYQNTGLITANGLYPALRVVSQSSLFQCSISVWYAGSASPLAYSQAPLASMLGYLQGVATAADAPGAIANHISGARIVVYGLWFQNQNQGGSRILRYFYATDTGCVTETAELMAIMIPDSVTTPQPPVVFPSSVVPLSYGPVGSALCSNLVGTGGSGGVTGRVMYRYE